VARVERFALPADPTRRAMLLHRHHTDGVRVSDLAQRVGLSSAATSQALRVLRNQQIVATHRDGRNVYYRLDNEMIHRPVASHRRRTLRRRRAALRLVLLSHASTAAVRTASFPADEELDPRGRREATRLAGRLRRVDEVRSAPSRRCQQTAALVLGGAGAQPVADPGLAGPDYGRWAGRSLDDVAGHEPDEFRGWLADTDARPHGGEPLSELTARIGRWADSVGAAPDGHVLLAVVDPAVLRAAIVHATGASPDALARIDVTPLTFATLTGGPGGWHLRSLHPAFSGPDDELGG